MGMSVTVVCGANAVFYVYLVAAAISLYCDSSYLRDSYTSTRLKNVSALLRIGQEASEPATYFYTSMRCALDWTQLLFWPGQCLELPLTLRRLAKEEEPFCSCTLQLQKSRHRLKSQLPDHGRLLNQIKFKIHFFQ